MTVTEINLITGQVNVRVETQQETADLAASTPTPLEQWQSDIAATDNVMPRFLEDHIKNEHNGICSDPFQQAAYDAKIALRATKPV